MKKKLALLAVLGAAVAYHIVQSPKSKVQSPHTAGEIKAKIERARKTRLLTSSPTNRLLTSSPTNRLLTSSPTKLTVTGRVTVAGNGAGTNGYWLAWDFTNSLPVYFELYHSTDLTHWSWWTNALASPVPMPTRLAREYFKMREVNPNTGEKSDWATR